MVSSPFPSIYVEHLFTSEPPKKHITDAPLKETLSATAMLYAPVVGTKPVKNGQDLLDPMCGSGTIVLEAMGIACNRAPGLIRTDWNVFRWKKFERSLWQKVHQQASDSALSKPPVKIIGFDIDASAIECVRHNANKQGVPTPTLSVQPLNHLQPPTKFDT